jgi:hypothetical protein
MELLYELVRTSHMLLNNASLMLRTLFTEFGLDLSNAKSAI